MGPSWATVIKNMSNGTMDPTLWMHFGTDNLSIISTQNGFYLPADDFGETLNSNTYTSNSANFTVNGLIGIMPIKMRSDFLAQM